VGSGGMVTKVEAARIATDAGIPVVLAAATHARAALAGDTVGTAFAATGRRRATRLLWLAHASQARGRLLLDAGAVRAVLAGRASLLPAGVTASEGDFEAGDPVDLVGPDGVVMARGLVAYDAVEVPQLLGRSTSDLVADLGEGYDRELVHRDDLILIDPRA
jgi:glutamate 5-kinase